VHADFWYFGQPPVTGSVDIVDTTTSEVVESVGYLLNSFSAYVEIVWRRFMINLEPGTYEITITGGAVAELNYIGPFNTSPAQGPDAEVDSYLAVIVVNLVLFIMIITILVKGTKAAKRIGHDSLMTSSPLS
jgi:hypothetical protein